MEERDPRNPGEEPMERRTAMEWLIKGFLSLWALGAAAVGASFLKAPEQEKRPNEGLVRCGPFSSLAVGDARFIRHGSDPIYVIRISDTQVLALPAVCTHLRCILKWNPPTQTFLCPCHNGAFDRNGNVLSGPPTRPLAPYRADVQADEIVVRT
jgi:cytochrome b6-f complex iron-sulfur subunit